MHFIAHFILFWDQRHLTKLNGSQEIKKRKEFSIPFSSPALTKRSLCREKETRGVEMRCNKQKSWKRATSPHACEELEPAWGEMHSLSRSPTTTRKDSPPPTALLTSKWQLQNDVVRSAGTQRFSLKINRKRTVSLWWIRCEPSCSSDTQSKKLILFKISLLSACSKKLGGQGLN